MVHMFVVFAITAVAEFHDNNIARMHAHNVTVGPVLDATEKRLVGATDTAASGLDKEDFDKTDKTIKLVTGAHGEISATAADLSASLIEEEFHTALAAKQAELDKWKAEAEQRDEEIKRQAEEIKLLQTRIHEYAKKEKDESLSETGMTVSCTPTGDGTCRRGHIGFRCGQLSPSAADMRDQTRLTAKKKECLSSYERGTLRREYYACSYQEVDMKSFNETGALSTCVGVSELEGAKRKGLICYWKDAEKEYQAQLYTDALKGRKPTEDSGKYTCQNNENVGGSHFCRWVVQKGFLYSKYKRCKNAEEEEESGTASLPLCTASASAQEVSVSDVNAAPKPNTEKACAFEMSD